MPYSVDPEENKQNAYSPSPLMTLHEQLIYKIAALDSALQAGFRRLDEKMDRFQNDLHISQIETNDRINKLESTTDARFLLKRTRLDAVEKRITEVETWQKVSIAKLAGAFGVVTIMWVFFGQAVQHAVQGIFG